jgi:hypothetical protein
MGKFYENSEKIDFFLLSVWAGKVQKASHRLRRNQLIFLLVILRKFSVNCFLMVVEP